MSEQKEIAGRQVSFDAEGFMTDPGQWDAEIARALAAEIEIDLTDRHFLVLEFMRKEFAANGTAPSLRKIKNDSGVGTKELYQLFPKGPAKKAARIAGLGKPEGCI
jgi:tRNA 2-thiouridine synthesizing protein E